MKLTYKRKKEVKDDFQETHCWDRRKCRKTKERKKFNLGIQVEIAVRQLDKSEIYTWEFLAFTALTQQDCLGTKKDRTIEVLSSCPF